MTPIKKRLDALEAHRAIVEASMPKVGGKSWSEAIYTVAGMVPPDFEDRLEATNHVVKVMCSFTHAQKEAVYALLGEPCPWPDGFNFDTATAVELCDLYFGKWKP